MTELAWEVSTGLLHRETVGVQKFRSGHAVVARSPFGDDSGVWSPAEAREYAAYLLQAAAVADGLDKAMALRSPAERVAVVMAAHDAATDVKRMVSLSAPGDGLAEL
jgi:hypothetical protein